MMMSKIIALVALFGAAVASPVRMFNHQIAGQLGKGGAGFAAMGANSAGAAGSEDAGIAGASSEDGTAFGAAMPGGGLAGAFGKGFFPASPSA